MGEPLIALHGATVRRSERLILDHIELTVRRGEIVTLIGPNGAGKSTVVRVLLALERLNEGHVQRSPGLRVGYLPQRYQLDQALPMTVSRLLSLTHRHSRQRQLEVLTELHVA